MTAAEASFRKILEVEPDHVQANHNLCVVFVEKGDLVKGEECLVKTLKLAPNEAYISQHLNIVRSRLHAAKVQHELLSYFVESFNHKVDIKHSKGCCIEGMPRRFVIFEQSVT